MPVAVHLHRWASLLEILKIVHPPSGSSPWSSLPHFVFISRLCCHLDLINFDDTHACSTPKFFDPSPQHARRRGSTSSEQASNNP